ncbi:hypothetical protein Q8A73_012592 [Channa argus]|nr:hypothetical protein Q8A73_012592 [Channa argus]
MAVIELIGIAGYAFYYCSSYADVPVMSFVGTLIGSFTSPGQTLFPIFTCVERYVAVVHPITYQRLRQESRVRIRNITSGCIWLTCSIWVGFLIMLQTYNNLKRCLAALVLILSLIVMVFCSISVLRVLIHPRPGKLGMVWCYLCCIYKDQENYQTINIILDQLED